MATKQAQQIIGIDGYNVEIKKSKSRKTIRLSFNPLTGGFTLNIPEYSTPFDIQRFMGRCEAWMAAQVATKTVQKTFITDGSRVSICGKPLTIRFELDIKAGAEFTDSELIIRGSRSRHHTLLTNTIMDLTQKILYQRSFVMATKLNCNIESVTLRSNKTRWGSCSHNGKLSYCWKIIFAPDQVIDYLCAHEVAHLIEMNHSKKFWDVVQNLCPNFKEARRWLKTHGSILLNTEIGIGE
jgi:predicted metal-dependent hydrolase